MRPAVFDSMSGLRPTSAFLLIGVILALIGAWTLRLAFGDGSEHASRRVEVDPTPAHSLVDREGRPMSQHVPRLDLVCSPNALWQAHTPERLIALLEQVFRGRFDERELAARLFPDARDGWVRVAVEIDAARKRALEHWLARGTLDETDEPRAVEGFAIKPKQPGRWELWWLPATVLSTRTRTLHVPHDDKNPLRWSRRLADGLARCWLGESALTEGGDERALKQQRADVWQRLMPTTYAVAIRGFDSACAPRLFELLNDEGVLFVQMHIARERDRIYPMGPLQVLGQWGYLDRATAAERSLRSLGLPESLANSDLSQWLSEDDLRAFEKRTRAELASLHPTSGLEVAAHRLLADDQWTFLERSRAEYAFERHVPVRRRSPRIEPRSYFLSSEEASETPRVVTTLDAYLQLEVGRQLDLLMANHKPAIAMAIALDVQSGDVLAVDSREAYGFSAFAPVQHQFTPGSTTKVLVMAAALEEGVVTPEERFDVGQGAYAVPDSSRVIREADNPEKTGVCSAAECLAHSLNAGMVQIGTRVDPERMRGFLRALRYGELPHAGLGPESTGFVPLLPWKKAWTQASVSFGHELRFSLWQHAAGLATVVRGGRWLPLRLIEAVEQDGLRYSLPRVDGERVFSPQTCAMVREMMRLGAEVGTGEPVAGPAVLPELEVGTKTGTAEKVASEMCLHVELGHNETHLRAKSSCSKSCRASLRAQKSHARACYTSSICAYGRLPGTDREVLVLVVADEPRVGKYGSRVAGPYAIAILREALGVTALGVSEADEIAPGFLASSLASFRSPDRPWAEVVRR